MTDTKELYPESTEAIRWARNVASNEIEDRELRHKIDKLLTYAFLLARDGNLDKLNGGYSDQSLRHFIENKGYRDE